MNNKCVTNKIKESKYLSYLLRHGAKERNLRISSDGFVEVDEILKLPQSKNYKLNCEIIRNIVENNDKKRFELKTLDNKLHIRACQGHSIKDLDEAQMMQQISNSDEFPLVVHGTFNRFLPSIQKEGLRIMNRNHIHFATGYPGYNKVISGVRRTCEVFIEIDLKKAMADGVKFFVASNGVVLTSGVGGILDSKYFKKILKMSDISESEREKISKYLSFLLRHCAKKQNLQISVDGFVEVDAILRLPQSSKFSKLNREMIESFVYNHNGLKRFELKTVDNNLHIRACYGHSIKDVDETQMMQPITNPEDFPLVIYLTSNECLPSIQKEGINKMNKIHIHFWTEYPDKKLIKIPGRQENLDAFIEIDLRKAMEDGVKFFIASDGILLTPGINGVLDKKYFKSITLRQSN